MVYGPIALKGAEVEWLINEEDSGVPHPFPERTEIPLPPTAVVELGIVGNTQHSMQGGGKTTLAGKDDASASYRN